MNFWFTADPHFWHTNIIRFCNRPFSSTKEMNETMVENWNNRVDVSDTIYILGDFALNASAQMMEGLLAKLHGKKIFITGDHDKQIWKCKNSFQYITPLDKIAIDNTQIILCHYCLRVWAKSHYNSWHCYGHSHGTLPPIGKSHDVGMDNNNFAPISFDELTLIMNNRPNNVNYLGDRRRSNNG